MHTLIYRLLIIVPLEQDYYCECVRGGWLVGADAVLRQKIGREKISEECNSHLSIPAFYPSLYLHCLPANEMSGMEQANNSDESGLDFKNFPEINGTAFSGINRKENYPTLHTQIFKKILTRNFAFI